MIDIDALVLAGLIYMHEKEQEKNKMKTFDKKDVFSWSNCKDANQFQRCKGYFGDSLEELNKQIEENHLLMLKDVFCNNSKCFCVYDDSRLYSLFVPLYKEKEKEKKYRPFRDFNEFSNTLGLVHILGSEITYRIKTEDTKGSAIITRECTSNHMPYISLGSHSLSLENLFKYYEWLDKDGNWQPFGVKE